MCVHALHGVPAKTRLRFLPVVLGSLAFLEMIDFTLSQSLVEHQQGDEWVRNTIIETSFRSEVTQLAAYRKLQNRRDEVDERAPTTLEEDFVNLLTEEIQTLLREDRDPENIFEFENDACGSRRLL